jgi:hypothetical protein
MHCTKQGVRECIEMAGLSGHEAFGCVALVQQDKSRPPVISRVFFFFFFFYSHGLIRSALR